MGIDPCQYGTFVFVKHIFDTNITVCKNVSTVSLNYCFLSALFFVSLHFSFFTISPCSLSVLSLPALSLSVCLSVCLSLSLLSLFVCLSVCLSVLSLPALFLPALFLFVCCSPFVCLSLPALPLSVYLSLFCVSVCLSLPAHSVCLCLFVYQYVSL